MKITIFVSATRSSPAPTPTGEIVSYEFQQSLVIILASYRRIIRQQ